MLKLTKRLLMQPLRQLRRILVVTVGGTVLLIGVVMLMTPGPAVVVAPAGLAILALEFAWARNLLRKARGFVAASNHHLRPGGHAGGPRPDGVKGP